MRVATYCRVSTEDQVQQYGLPSQRACIAEYIKQNGHETRPEWSIEDDGWSGVDLNRPGMNALRDLIGRREVDAILSYDQDRLSRNLGHTCLLKDECDSHGVKLLFVTTKVEDSAEGKLFLSMKGAFAEYERAKILDRTQRGRRQKAIAGHVVGGRPTFGYHYLGRSQGARGHYQVNEDEAQIVRQIFSWLLRGVSVRQIVTLLNESGSRPQRGKRWAKSSVHRILTNETYAGRMFYNRRMRAVSEKFTANMAPRRNKKTVLRPRQASEHIEISVPAILGLEFSEKAQAQLRNNAAHMSGHSTPGRYLLKSLIRCARCGRAVVGTPCHGRSYYRCAGRNRLEEQPCRSSWIPGARLENAVWSAVRKALLNPSILEAKIREHQKSLGATAPDRVQPTAQRQRIDVLRRREELILQNMSDPSLVTYTQKFKAQLRETTEEIQRIEAMFQREGRNRAVSLRSKPASVAKLCALAARGIDCLDREGQRKLLQALVQEIRVSEDIEIHGILPSSLPTTVHNGSTLWPPAAATSSARLAVVWPRTSQKSGKV